MFDIGFSELALIAILALLIAGPERLPGIMRGLGHIAGRARHIYGVMRNELEREMDSVKSEAAQQENADSDESGDAKPGSRDSDDKDNGTA